jgi:hypothetical protein
LFVGDATLLICLQFVDNSEFVTADIFESFFPYGLVRNAYFDVYKVGFAT